MLKIKDKERIQILNALKSGVVPPVGLKHIQVGRIQELNEMVKDIDHIVNGGSTVRFIVGRFGTGKSFFLTLTKLMAHEKRLVVMNADVTIDKILCSSDGKARFLLTDLIKSISTRSKPEGNGLKSIIESFISNLLSKTPDPTEHDFYLMLQPVSDLNLSQDFSKVLYLYYKAFKENNSILTEQCLKWIKAEYETKTEAKLELGVSRIIEDSDFYDVLVLFSAFSKLAGFSGLLVEIDELAVLVRQRSPVRMKNYEALLTIINTGLQGTVENIGFIFGATDEALSDRERGVFSYEALETRLSENKFATGERKDLTGIVMRLPVLKKEEVFLLLTILRDIHANGDENKKLIPNDGIEGFMAAVFSQMGASEFLNPRYVIKDYLGILSLLESNPNTTWRDYLGNVSSIIESQSSDLVRLKG